MSVAFRHGPGFRQELASVWTGLVMITDEMEDDGLTFVIHREILEIDPTALFLIILDAGRMAEIGQRRGDLMTGDGVPAFAQIAGFEIIEIRAKIHVTIGCALKAVRTRSPMLRLIW